MSTATEMGVTEVETGTETTEIRNVVNSTKRTRLVRTKAVSSPFYAKQPSVSAEHGRRPVHVPVVVIANGRTAGLGTSR